MQMLKEVLEIKLLGMHYLISILKNFIQEGNKAKLYFQIVRVMLLKTLMS